MGRDWKDEARARLIALRRDCRAWGYGPLTAPAVEPTALAGLALLGDDPGSARASAAWLSAIRSRSGWLGVSSALGEPGWPTPIGMLLWAAVGGYRAERSAALAWLLTSEGLAFPHAEGDPLGHDTSKVGWPWVAGTHSWVEPTALAILALGREGRLDDPRAAEGLAVIRDRAIPSGGWNLGNPVVFGAELRPVPAPTGLALLALARAGGAAESAVGPAVAYLRSTLPTTTAPASLGWGVLGLRAWGFAPEEAAPWLERAFAHAARKAEASAMALALLLLAASDGAMTALGITPRARRSACA